MCNSIGAPIWRELTALATEFENPSGDSKQDLGVSRPHNEAHTGVPFLIQTTASLFVELIPAPAPLFAWTKLTGFAAAFLSCILVTIEDEGQPLNPKP